MSQLPTMHLVPSPSVIVHGSPSFAKAWQVLSAPQ
jgi:hypothetical protein